MPLVDIYRVVRDASRDHRNALQANRSKLSHRLLDVFLRTWDLGFTAFGGPPVHFKIIHQRFVEGIGGKAPWIDEQTYQELFAICQALPGPGSTKMLFCVVLLHAGFWPALFVFFTWSLPVAAIMFGLAVAVGHIQQQLPDPVYALLSGLNASTVGIIALAAVQLAERAITDRLSRILVIFGACAGLCYTALWYFPTIMVAGGVIASLWDTWLNKRIDNAWNKIKKKRTNKEALEEENIVTEAAAVSSEPKQPPNASQVSKSEDPNEQRPVGNTEQDFQELSPVRKEEPSQEKASDAKQPSNVVATELNSHSISIKVGLLIIIFFFLSFIALMVVRGIVKNSPRTLSLFANMYLAGTIIFGGGPVVIPLLREYVVQPGWVTPRDFLIGLAIIQAAPGPNFNFAVYLGALALRGTPWPMVLGAFLGWAGIFFPGITLAVGVQALWRVLRSRPYIVAGLRGINASAIGLVFTAVYRLWQIGYLTNQAAAGQSLALNPWWVVVTALAYAESAWFRVPPAVSILGGAILGLCWYGAIGRFHQ